MTDTDLINPRTNGERRAFLEGWAQCLLTVDREGAEVAREWLLMAVEVEKWAVERRQAPPTK